MTLDCTCAVPESHMLTIALPPEFTSHRMVRILVEELDDVDKIAMMQEAAADPLYCAEMSEVGSDWAIVDGEGV